MLMNQRIREQRVLKSWTQQELADKLDVSVDMIKSLEVGRAKPSIETLTKLSDVFECSSDYLLGKSDIPNPATTEDVYKKVIRDIEEQFNVKLHDDPEIVEAFKKVIDLMKNQKDS